MFNREKLTSAYSRINKQNKASLTLDEIVIVCQAMGMNTTGHKVKSYFETNGTQTPGEVSLEEFIDWFKATNPNLYSESG